MAEPFELPELSFPGPRRADAHKGDFGKVLIIAGSPGLTGAAYLAGKAALRTGSGLVTIAVPASLNAILEAKTTCVMTLPVPEENGGVFTAQAAKRILDFAEGCDSIGLGPGIGRDDATRPFVLEIVRSLPKPMVIDADGLFHIAGDPDTLKSAAGPRIVTPHPGEFSKLTGKPVSEIQARRDQAAREFAAENGVVCVLKGRMTVTSDGKNTRTNMTGNPGMATGGTGDVLTGIIASLLGQGMEPYKAACGGVYLHGLVGDITAENRGEHSMIASDMIENLPEAVKICFRKN
ncbi:MAG: NAD(P)H-hydrate dehydratase [Planctomycetota bacterium]|jgi:NAD(P)H-hydrate epimerase